MMMLVAVETDVPVPNRNLVLLVEDDRAVARALKSLKRLLQLHGSDTLLFHSADAFKKHDDFENVICVILDVDLRDGSGFVLRLGLKAAGVSVPVIYLTGNDNPAVRRVALACGCVD